MVDYTVQIARNLKNIRVISGYTQTEVARAIGVSYQQIQKYESGANRISAEKLFALKVFYGANIEEFFAGPKDEDTVDRSTERRQAYLHFMYSLSNMPDQKLRQAVEHFASSLFEIGA